VANILAVQHNHSATDITSGTLASGRLPATINATTNYQFNGTNITTRYSAKVTTQFDKTNTTLADVTGLSVPLAAGHTYAIRAVLHISPDATGGIKIATGGTATSTTYRHEYIAVRNDNNTIGATQASGTYQNAFSTSGGVYYDVTFEATILVNAGGTLTIQFAESSASGTSSVLWGSYMTAEDLN
jgi:hypothetical protein